MFWRRANKEISWPDAVTAALSILNIQHGKWRLPYETKGSEHASHRGTGHREKHNRKDSVSSVPQ